MELKTRGFDAQPIPIDVNRMPTGAIPATTSRGRPVTAYLTAYPGRSVARQDALWHEGVIVPNTRGTPWHVLTLPGKEGQSPLNPKVQGSIPCASTRNRSSFPTGTAKWAGSYL
jgi:hypothetical protein